MTRPDPFAITGLLTAGVDEAGRGPLAGPVIAAAVILDPGAPITGLKDSKQLGEAARERLAQEIKHKSISWGIGRAEVEEIDEINILQASLLAMQRAVERLDVYPELALIDGNKCPPLQCEARAIVKGDRTVASISAASILAKVSRDSEMVNMEYRYPGYGFARHKGYPTRQHLQALAEKGLCDIHRRTFSPVKQYL